MATSSVPTDTHQGKNKIWIWIARLEVVLLLPSAVAAGLLDASGSFPIGLAALLFLCWMTYRSVVDEGGWRVVVLFDHDHRLD